MGKTILLPIASDAKFKARIRVFCCSTGRTTMERFLFASALDLETLPAVGHLVSLTHLAKNLRPEEQEVIRERNNHCQPVRIRVEHKSQEQKATRDPCEPFKFHWQDE